MTPTFYDSDIFWTSIEFRVNVIDNPCEPHLVLDTPGPFILNAILGQLHSEPLHIENGDCDYTATLAPRGAFSDAWQDYDLDDFITVE